MWEKTHQKTSDLLFFKTGNHHLRLCKGNCDLEERYIQSSRPAKFSQLLLL